MKRVVKHAKGFSMVELMFVAFAFTVIAGTVFSLLMSSQKHYQSESDLTTAFQQANVVIDQITRDVHSAGYPPANAFNANPPSYYFAVPFAWYPGYPNAPCTVGATCTIPGDYDLILEADVGNGNGVQWIRYSLVGTTLMRGMTTKTDGDPASATDPSSNSNLMTPYLENVLNGNQSIPIFSYSKYDSNEPPLPANIREVKITLIVQSAKADPQTGQFRSITLTGQAVRFNPNK